MYMRLALIPWTNIMYENNSYSRKQNVVSRDHFIWKQLLFTHLNVNYDNEKHVYEV